LSSGIGTMTPNNLNCSLTGENFVFFLLFFFELDLLSEGTRPHIRPNPCTGGNFNPFMKAHGGLNFPVIHARDFGNVTADGNSFVSLNIVAYISKEPTSIKG
jgi:hypothetical protein